MENYLQKILNKSQSRFIENKQFIKWLRKKTPKDLDNKFHEFHEEAFEDIDCLDCANCCSSISPAIKDRDVQKLASSLRISPSEVVDQYLYLDEEQDYVLKSTPCPFLDTDNYCLHYENRPKACREYPHTEYKRMHQYLNLAQKNLLICPAVFVIIEKLKTFYK